MLGILDFINSIKDIYINSTCENQINEEAFDIKQYVIRTKSAKRDCL